VTQLASYFEPLILAAVGVASKMLDHQQQMTVLDQTKTLAESALQMLYAAKEGGGNPKVCFKPWGGGGWRGSPGPSCVVVFLKKHLQVDFPI
jgi:hypothetical protein